MTPTVIAGSSSRALGRTTGIRRTRIYPGLGGGLWLRMVFPAGLVTWLVPSG
jgi:hypothetical protein